MHSTKTDKATSAGSSDRTLWSRSADGSHSSDGHPVLSFSHREARMPMEKLNEFCKAHDATPQSVCFTTWSIVLYHMTGQSEISVDVESHYPMALAERPECRTFNMTLRSTTTALELITQYKVSEISSSRETATQEPSISNVNDKHMFKMIQEAKVFQDELDKTVSSSLVSSQS